MKPEKNEILIFKELCDRTGFKISFFILPALFLALAAVFEGISMVTLIPLANGIITNHFDTDTRIYFWLQKLHWDVIDNSPGKATFVFLLLTILGSVFLKNVFQYTAMVIADRYGIHFMEKIRGLIFRRYLSFGKQFFDRQNLGRLVDVNLGFTRHIQNTLTHITHDLSLAFIVAVYLVVMVFISWQLTVFSLLLFPVLYYAADWLIRKIRENAKRESKLQIQLAGLISNAISRIVLIKAYNKEEEEAAEVEAMARKTSELEESVIRKQRLVPPIQETLVIVGCLVLISIAAIFFKGTEKITSLIVFLIVLRRMAQNLTSLERIRVLLASIGGAIKEVAWVFEEGDKPYVADGREKFTGLKAVVEFTGLNFAYQPGVNVLKNINLRIEKGKTTAVIGKTGSGKTTLTNLLMRFYDCAPGTVLMDGHDIRGFEIASLRENIAFVPQEPILFNDSLRNNLFYGLDRVPDEKEIETVLRKARLEDYIKSLPQGLDTFVGDRGVQLSGGEKQRMAIARAILKNSGILILDEATSALDSKTEQQIQEAIKEAVSGKTSIVIAHRLSTIRHADKIVVLEDGRIVEEGSLDELLSKKEKFFTYWSEQRAAG